MNKLLGAAAAAAIMAGATTAQAVPVQYGGNMSGLAFNEVNDTGSGITVAESTGGNSDYSLIRTDGTTALHLPFIGNTASNAAAPLASLGQFKYTLFFDQTGAKNVGDNSATPMTSIDWSGGKIVFQQGNAIQLDNFGGFGNPDLTGTLTFTGGVMNLGTTPDRFQSNETEDLPFGLGINHQFLYEVESGYMDFTLVLNSGVTIDGTIDLDNLNVGDNGRFNGVLIDPSNTVPGDIAFFFAGEADRTDFACTGGDPGVQGSPGGPNGTQGTPCGQFTDVDVNNQSGCVPGSGPGCGASQYLDTWQTYEYKLDLEMKFAGWGPGATETPEPATLAMLGMGLVGLGLVRRRWRSA